MELKDFVIKFANQFEESDTSSFNAETKFRDVDEWSSLMALTIIAMVDSEYNVKITGDEIKKSETILDIFNLIQLKK